MLAQFASCEKNSIINHVDDHNLYTNLGCLAQSQSDDSITAEDDATGAPTSKMSMPSNSQSLGQISKILTTGVAPEMKQAKGALPEGFFDNKDADFRARGIKPVKIDVK